jgi:hypothetical protein
MVDSPRATSARRAASRRLLRNADLRQPRPSEDGPKLAGTEQLARKRLASGETGTTSARSRDETRDVPGRVRRRPVAAMPARPIDPEGGALR